MNELETNRYHIIDGIVKWVKARIAELDGRDSFLFTTVVLQPAEWKNGKKTGKARYIALTPKWVAWVKARIEALDGRDGFLFTTTHGCQWVCTSWVSSFDRVRKNAKLPENITLYNVRHTWITRALLKGIPIADVANQAGTSAAVIEKHYSKVHLHRESRKAAVMALA